MATSALAISSIGALMFLIPVKGWKAGGTKATVLVSSMKPHIYNVTFGPPSTDPVRNAVLSLFVSALRWRTAVADSRRWLCVSLSPLSLCSDQLEVTWLFLSLCPTSRCKVLLQSLPRTLQLHLSYTALCSRSSVKSEVLKGPRRVFLSVDLWSEAGNYHRKEMKGLLEYWMNSLPCIVCIVHIITTYFWPFDRLLFVANINSIPLIAAVWDTRGFASHIQLLEQRWNSKTIIHYKVLWPKIISLVGSSENNTRFLTNLKCQARLCIFSIIKGQLIQNSFASNFICNLDHCRDIPLGRNMDTVKSG